MSWKDKQLIGFSIKSPEELKRIASLGIVNMVEIKVEQFARAGLPLYFYEDGDFYPNGEALKKLSFELCDGLDSVQFHLPIEKSINPKIESGLNIGVLAHHEIFMRKFQMLEEIYQEYKIGRTLTLHPPLTYLRGKQILDDEDALENARKFFRILDAIRFEKKHETLIGVENQSDPKILGGNLGYMPGHFRKMLKKTRTIGLTLDSGHRRLTRTTERKLEFRTRDFLALGIPINNIHFHGNSAEFNPKNFDDDQHLFANKDNVNGYDSYAYYFRRYRTPVVLEISHLEKYSDAELIENVERIKNDLK